MFLFHQKRNAILWIAREFVKEIFKISLISYLAFYLIDGFIDGFVSVNFNLNILLAITIISGTLTVIVEKEGSQHEKQRIKIKDYVLIVILGLISAALIYYRINEIGRVAYVISAISGLVIIIISVLLIYNPPDLDDKD